MQNQNSEFYLVRHGPVETDYRQLIYGRLNVDADFTGCEAELDYLRHTLPNKAIWVSSPLNRCLQTAAELGIDDPKIDTLLVEQDFGDWHEKNYEEIWENNQQLDWDDPAGITPEKGESFENVVKRTAAVPNFYQQNYAGEKVVIIFHGGTIRGFLASILGMSAADALKVAIDPLSVTKITAFSENHWRVDYINRQVD